ncbi:MAG: hypothetical protein H6868_08480 [Rhodospirillales bacterium]|nr:hypothetical protein [Rhodospirillales bacterium]
MSIGQTIPREKAKLADQMRLAVEQYKAAGGKVRNLTDEYQAQFGERNKAFGWVDDRPYNSYGNDGPCAGQIVTDDTGNSRAYAPAGTPSAGNFRRSPV